MIGRAAANPTPSITFFFFYLSQESTYGEGLGGGSTAGSLAAAVKNQDGVNSVFPDSLALPSNLPGNQFILLKTTKQPTPAVFVKM